MQTIVFILGAILLVLILWIFPHLQLKFSKADIKGKDRIELKNKLRLTLAQILGGAFILGGLFFTWQSLNVSKEGQITERFTRAINQLGDEQLQIRLGGIYALERIAKDSKRDHWPIMEILTAYIRTRAPWPAENREEKKSLTEKKTPPPDIQAILTVIGRRIHTSEEERNLVLSNTDLRGANLMRANLMGANLEEANLREANLREANLEGANLEGANVMGADLIGADLMGADLMGANLEGVNLREAYLEGVNFEGAFLIGADLREADLREANLRKAFLWGAYLEGADLTEANLMEADLEEANLSGATLWDANLIRANLSEANLYDADLIGADLSGVKSLTINQLAVVRTLYNTKLGPSLRKQIEEKYPDLLKKPKSEEEE